MSQVILVTQAFKGKLVSKESKELKESMVKMDWLVPVVLVVLKVNLENLDLLGFLESKAALENLGLRDKPA